MRIGYIIPEFPSQTHIFFWREIVALRGMGEDVFLISTRRPPAGACRHEFAEPAAAETHYTYPPRFVASIAALLARPRSAFRALRYIAGLHQSPLKRRLRCLGLMLPAADLWLLAREHRLDHLHAHSCADAAHMVALCRILGGPPYSLTLHGDLPVYGTDHKSKMARAKFVSCVTRPLQEQLVNRAGVPLERAPLIWMGVETDRFRDAGLRRPVPGRLHLVTVARLQMNKGHRFALAALSAAREQGYELTYTIVGDGPDRASIEEEIKRLGLSPSVALTGTQSETAILELLQKADAFILPSVGQGEAAPVSVMEAMASGLPVICSVIGGTPDMITDGLHGLLTPQGDVPAITKGLIRLAKDVQERERLGQAARQRALEMFDSRQTARLLWKAMQRPSAGREDRGSGEARPLLSTPP
jgi:glycosyltransferase involved in cell wall biosynthesis